MIVAERSGQPAVAAAANADTPERLTLSRWSRLKRASAEGAASAPVNRDVPSAVTGTPANPASTTPDSPPPELPPLASISLNTDFTPFMQAKVPAELRRQALKALFREPHFNTMDGLDTYIDDYTQFEPIAPDVLEKLSAWQTIKNPPQMVVADGGYAVDAASDEGRAILAARAESAASVPTITGTDTVVDALGAELSPVPLSVRYGTRVGDFDPASGLADAAAGPALTVGAEAVPPALAATEPSALHAAVPSASAVSAA